MQILKYFFGSITVIISLLGFVVGIAPEEVNEPISGYMTRVVLLLFGSCLLISGYKNYKIGFGALLGGFLIGGGGISLIRSLETGDFGDLQDQVWTMIAAYIIMFAVGLLLIKEGIKSNLKKVEKPDFKNTP